MKERAAPSTASHSAHIQILSAAKLDTCNTLLCWYPLMFIHNHNGSLLFWRVVSEEMLGIYYSTRKKYDIIDPLLHI